MGTSKKEINKDYLFNLLMPTAAADLPGIASDLPEPAPVKQAASDRAGLAALGNAVNVRPVRELVLVNLNERLLPTVWTKCLKNSTAADATAAVRM